MLKPTVQLTFEQLTDILFDLILASKRCVDDFNVCRLYLLFYTPTSCSLSVRDIHL